MITLCTLVMGKYGTACGPVDRISHRSDFYLALCEDFKKAKADFSFDEPVRFPSKWRISSRQEFRISLGESSLRPMVDVLLMPETTKKRLVHPSIRKVISSASRRLADGIYSNLAGEIVASAITCFEILLSTKKTDFDTIARRLEMLAGMDRLEVGPDGKKVRVGAVKLLFDSRHKWIHAGYKPNLERVEDAKMFGIEALIHFSELAIKAPNAASHEDLMEWLDYHWCVRKGNTEALRVLSTEVSDPFKW